MRLAKAHRIGGVACEAES